MRAFPCLIVLIATVLHAANFSAETLQLVQDGQDTGLHNTQIRWATSRDQIIQDVFVHSPWIQGLSQEDQQKAADLFNAVITLKKDIRHLDSLFGSAPSDDALAQTIRAQAAFFTRSENTILSHGSHWGRKLKSQGIPLHWRCQYWLHLSNRQCCSTIKDLQTYPSWMDDIVELVSSPFPQNPARRNEAVDDFAAFWAALDIKWRELFIQRVGIDQIKDAYLRNMLQSSLLLDKAFYASSPQDSLLHAQTAELLRHGPSLDPEPIWSGQILLTHSQEFRLSRAEAKYWLNNSLRHHFDTPHVYKAYQEFLLESPEANDYSVLEFATACLNTHRFDTYVPYYSIETMRLAGEKRGDLGYFFRQPGIFAMVESYYAARIPVMDAQFGIDKGTRTQYMAIAILNNEHAIARRLWNEMQGNIEKSRLDYYHMTRQQVEAILFPSRVRS